MGPTWVLSAPGRPHVRPTNFAIRESTLVKWATGVIHCQCGEYRMNPVKMMQPLTLTLRGPS